MPRKRITQSPPSETPDAPLAWDGWLAPSVAVLEQGSLVCPVEPVDDGWHRAIGDPAMLAAFRLLGDDASGAEIRDYATRWGVLLLCSAHGLPASHWSEPSVFASGPTSWCPVSEVRGAYWTRLDDWRRYARIARAVDRIAAVLRSGALGADDDWATLSDEYGYSLRPVLDATGVAKRSKLDKLEWQRRGIAHIVGLWLQMGGVAPQVRWQSSVPQIVFGSGRFAEAGFFGGLAVQLMLAVADRRELARCSACARPYVPTRKPNPSRDNYCPDCGRTAALSRAAARWRKKQETERSTSKDAPATEARHGQARKR